MKICYKILAIILLISVNSFGQFASNSFAQGVEFSNSSSMQGITTGDLNNDSKPEIITANISSGNTIRVFVNASPTNQINSNSFSSSFILNTLNANPGCVRVADLNADGKAEIVVAYNSTSNSNYSIFQNNYNGIQLNSSSFTRYDFATGSNPQGIAVGDFDLDGKPDIATSNYSSNNVYILKNNSSSSIISFSFALSLNVGSGPGSLACGDIDNDGKLDLATANWSGASISILRNTNSVIGLNSFTTITTGNGTLVQANPNWIMLTDFNKNGLKELVCSNWGANSISIYENISTSTISLGSRVDLSISPNQYPQGLGSADFDGDGKSDFALSVAGSPIVLAARNIHPGTSTINSGSFAGFMGYSANTSPVGFAVDDIDFDGRPDMISGNYSAQTISVFKNRMIAVEPNIQASNLTINKNLNTLTLNLTKGSGQKRIITCRLSGFAANIPIDSSWYVANDTFALGSNLGNGNYVVYNDTGSTVTVKGLAFGQTYQITVFEYNGVKGYSNYNVTSPPSLTSSIGDIFYSKSSGMLDLVTSWGPNADGSGVSPTSFNNPNTVYVVSNNGAPSISTNWVITGTGSFLKIGNGSTALNLTIPSGLFIFTDSIAVSQSATITFQGGLVTNKAFFDTLSTAQFISSTSQFIPGYNYYNIILAGGLKTLQNNVSVRNSFNMLANISTGNYLLTIGTSSAQPGSLTRVSGVINGRLRRWFPSSITSGTSGLFPIGSGTIYRPIQIDFTTAPSTGGFITGEFIQTNPGNVGFPIYDFSISPLVQVNKACNSGYWKMEPSIISGGQYSVTATGTNFNGISTLSTLRLVKRQANGAWVIDGTAVNGSGVISAPIVSRTGMQGIGEYTIAGDSTDNSLPLNWIDFQSYQDESEVSLKWKTTNEVNCDFFEIQRKFNESEYLIVGRLKANNQTKLNMYNWKENLEFDGTVFYRIKQVDFDGNYSFSKELALSHGSDLDPLIYFPNPATDNLFCSYCENESISIFDLNGKEFRLEFFNRQANLELIPNGLYFLKVKNGSKILLKE